MTRFSRIRAPTPSGSLSQKRSPLVLDVIYVLAVIALFVAVGLIGKAVEKL